MRGAARQSSAAAAAFLILAAAISTSVVVQADPTPSEWRPRPLRGSTSPPPPPSLSASAAVVDALSSSSLVFPLVGNVYPAGLFYVNMEIGNRHDHTAKNYSFDLDTGSHLTWVQCNAPCINCFNGAHEPYQPSREKVVPYNDPLCTALNDDRHHDSDVVVGGGVVDGAGIDALLSDRCNYEVSYADDGSSKGALVRDAILLRFADGTRHLQGNFVFGCGFDQRGGHPMVNKKIDGMMGLGGGSKVGLVSQLHTARVIRRNVFGHCMSRRGGGYLFLDDGLVPSDNDIRWVRMAVGGGVEHPLDEPNSHYKLPPAELYIGGSKATSPLQVSVFDSGSSYTYFQSKPYFELLHALMEHLKKKQLKLVTEDQTLTVCWKAPKPFKSVDDAAKHFVSLSLNFRDRKQTVQLNIPPENYLVISRHGNACLGILNGGEEPGLGDLNIIGVLDKLVVYDNEKKRIGWAPTSCHRLPPHNREPGTAGIPSSL